MRVVVPVFVLSFAIRRVFRGSLSVGTASSRVGNSRIMQSRGEWEEGNGSACALVHVHANARAASTEKERGIKRRSDRWRRKLDFERYLWKICKFARGFDNRRRCRRSRRWIWKIHPFYFSASRATELPINYVFFSAKQQKLAILEINHLYRCTIAYRAR